MALPLYAGVKVVFTPLDGTLSEKFAQQNKLILANTEGRVLYVPLLYIIPEHKKLPVNHKPAHFVN